MFEIHGPSVVLAVRQAAPKTSGRRVTERSERSTLLCASCLLRSLTPRDKTHSNTSYLAFTTKRLRVHAASS